MIEDLTLPQQAADFAKRFLDQIKASFQIDTQIIPISSSIGISVFPEEGMDIHTLLKHAGIALYNAKKAGKNQFHFFNKNSKFT